MFWLKWIQTEFHKNMFYDDMLGNTTTLKRQSYDMKSIKNKKVL